LDAAQEQPDQGGILDLLLTLSARKRLILGMALAGGLLAGGLALLLPPTYTATAVIMLPQQQQSSAAALLGQLGAIGSLAGRDLGVRNPADPYIGILNSQTVADEVITQFGLESVYRVKNLTDAREELASATRFNSSKYTLIQISVEDHDPQRAADMANAYVSQLQKQNSRLAVTEASQRRLFFERELEEEKAHLAEAEADLKRTQEQKGIYQVSSQVEAVIRSMAQLRAEVVAREVGLQRLKAGATTQNPEVLRQEVELTALRGQLRSLEASDGKKTPGDPLLATTAMPEAGLEYLRRLREVKYRESLFELLAKQYEAARIDEAREAPLIQIVDKAVRPDKRSAPSRNVYAALGVFWGGTLASIATLLGRAMQDPLRAGKVAALKVSWGVRR
jgi:tyrosine-protein kinase Etk/Wzc